MSLIELFVLLGRRKWVVLLGLLVGTILAFSSLYGFVEADGASALRLQRRSNTVYESQVSLLVDVPGFGLGRIDSPVDHAFRMAPTYAVLVTSEPVKSTLPTRVRNGNVSVTARALENSPVFTIAAQGTNAELVSDAAKAYAHAVVDYITRMQDESEVPEDKRLSIRVLSAPTPASALSSRDLQIAALLLVMPVGVSVAWALMAEGIANYRASLNESGNTLPLGQTQDSPVAEPCTERQA